LLYWLLWVQGLMENMRRWLLIVVLSASKVIFRQNSADAYDWSDPSTWHLQFWVVRGKFLFGTLEVGHVPWGYSGRIVKLTTHLHLVPRPKNEWSYTFTPPILHMVWCSV
jgi:hypothetical protein